MEKIELVRRAQMSFGTYGTIVMPDGQILATVERPWLNNAASISCIPAGEYECRPRRYNRGGYDAVEITNVPDRSYILFHVANVPTDVRGCVGVGNDFGFVKSQWAVTSSKLAFAEFMDQLNMEFILVISTL